ncbi:related to Probable alpha-1,6-mannosyltransferase MNN11 [Saccharomycodes ludwigii]|uniref:Related to Probable alpha-1,6-mannosyltransferase MNN11 n=1 Tax=Saccharomycodes ludwigii TaxID=36035 RepID=A0A376B612_9ASCO|nr:hypothetical protein SCDLUD_003946 [Saccharomycodes ludwigii]KAH3899663.1 hypothetical protein SCDLUD_003946 [Saccharomycodes ludwigii]SSD60135.1 related to Probable alpha-1,6-mannosyltransferase MNN11 [Saccharomycodes ludwigii]
MELKSAQKNKSFRKKLLNIFKLSFLNGLGGNKNRKSKILATILFATVVLFLIILITGSSIFGISLGTGIIPFSSSLTTNADINNIPSGKRYPPVHGLNLYETKVTNSLIFPQIEHLSNLKKMGYKTLFIRRTDINGKSDYYVKNNEIPMTDKEKKQLAAEADKTAFIKKTFLDLGKVVYRRKRKSNSPSVVIVTLLDYEKYNLESIVQIVQNRVDYAQKHNYGTYIRWAQEFIPYLEAQSLDTSYEFIKPLIMRAAMHTFPNTNNFWFIDEDGLIMNLGLSLQQHLLNPKILDLATLKKVPLARGSLIKTYNSPSISIDGKYKDVDTADLIFPQQQQQQGELETFSFVLSNNLYTHAFLDYLNDPLVRNYDWGHNNPLGKAITHCLQWHPSLLKRFRMVVPKTIASSYDPVNSKFPVAENQKGKEPFYVDNDMVVLLKDCTKRHSCAEDLTQFYEEVKH